MKKNYRLLAEDMFSAIEKIEEYTKSLNYKTFIQKKMAVDAVIRNIEIIGEAAKNIPEHIRVKYNNIPWSRMIGLRNITIHEYFGVDLDIIWKIVTKNLPETKPFIKKMLSDL